MVYRIFVEKKKELANEARGVLANINGLLQIESVTDVRVINRYDVENIEKLIEQIEEFNDLSKQDLANKVNHTENRKTPKTKTIINVLLAILFGTITSIIVSFIWIGIVNFCNREFFIINRSISKNKWELAANSFHLAL